MVRLRYFFKAHIYPTLARLGHSFGFSWQKISKRFGQDTLIAQLGDLKGPENVDKSNTPMNIIMLAYLGVFTTNNLIQIIIAKVLAARGHDVKVVLCDRILPLCETTDIHRHAVRDIICNYNLKFNKRLFEKSGLKIVWLSELVSNEVIDDLASNTSDKWKVYVDSILLRYFKVGKLDASNPLVSELHKRAKHAAFISEELGKAIVRLKPDRVAFAHGSYITRGPAKDVMNSAGIPTFSISRAKMAETQKLNWATPGDWWSVDEEWEKVKNVPLNDTLEEIIDEYLESRLNHKRDIVVFNHSEVEDEVKTYAKLGLSSDKKIYTLFTNVLWDAASAQREIVFADPLEWVTETIDYFIENPNRQLVVRIHPSENIIGTNQPMAAFIADRFPELPSNIKVLEPGIDINSWSLLKVTDIGLVHTSTVGMEIALEGIPCLCLSKTHYRNKGFTIDVNDKVEYFNILSNGVEVDIEEMKNLAKRYSYLLFLRYQLPMPFLNPESHFATKNIKDGLNMDTIAKTEGMKCVIEGIESKSPFLLSDKSVIKLYS